MAREEIIEEPGKSRKAPYHCEGRYTAIEARKGNSGNRIRLAPDLHDNGSINARHTVIEARSPQRQVVLDMVGSEGSANLTAGSSKQGENQQATPISESTGCWKELNKGAASGTDRKTAKE